MFLGDWEGESLRANLVVPPFILPVFAVGLLCAVLQLVGFSMFK